MVFHCAFKSLQVYFTWAGPTAAQEVVTFADGKRVFSELSRPFKRDTACLVQRAGNLLYFLGALNELVEVDLEACALRLAAGLGYAPAVHPIAQPVRAFACAGPGLLVAATTLSTLLRIDTNTSPAAVGPEKSIGGAAAGAVPRVTCVACGAAPAGGGGLLGPTVVAAYSEVYTESVFYLFDGLLELRTVADVQRQFFEVLALHVFARPGYSLVLAVCACDHAHLLLACEDVLAVLQQDFQLLDGVIRGLAPLGPAEAAVFGKTREGRGFLKKIRLPL